MLQGFWYQRARHGKLCFRNQQLAQIGTVKLGGDAQQGGIATDADLLEDGPHAAGNLRCFVGSRALLQRGPGFGRGIGIELHNERS